MKNEHYNRKRVKNMNREIIEERDLINIQKDAQPH